MGKSPGIYADISNSEYHRDEALGSTSLKTLATRTPAHWLYDSTHPKTSDAFTLGTAAHSLILEDDVSAFEIVDAANWLTKDAKAAKAEALATGHVPLLTKEFEQVQAMRDSVMAHPLARTALDGGVAESSLFWNHSSGTPLKARPDKWHSDHPKLGNLIIDLKTTVDANPRDFGRTAAKFGYGQSDALYRDGVQAITGQRPDFLFVLVEKQPPYLVSVVELHPDVTELGGRLNERAIQTYRACLERNEWPGYDTTDPVQLPKWAEYDLEELAL